jgi:prevent-host-death family protein
MGGVVQTWQMQEAKARLSELVKLAQSEGPQDITLHGRSVAVVLSRAAFERLSGCSQSLLDFMRQSPLYGLEEIEFERDRSTTREDPL